MLGGLGDYGEMFCCQGRIYWPPSFFCASLQVLVAVFLGLVYSEENCGDSYLTTISMKFGWFALRIPSNS